MSPDGLFLSLTNNNVYCLLLLPIPRAVTINTTHLPLCLPHRPSTATIHLTTMNPMHTLPALFHPVACTHTLLQFPLECPAFFFLKKRKVLSCVVAQAFRRQDVMNLAGSHASRSNSVMLQYFQKN